MAEGISEERFTEAIENVRREVNAGLTTAGVQIGAVEKTLSEKIGSLKLWGGLALVSGQTLAAVLTGYLHPSVAIHSTLRALGHLVA